MQQQTEEWRAARRGRLTGSNVGAALGMNPWKKPEDLIRQMVREYHGAESEFSGNVATEHGRLHEPLAALDYMGATGNVVVECGFFIHPEHDWLGASPDGLVDDDGLVEIKCPFSQRNAKAPEFKAALDQPHYYAQTQVEMACAQRRWCDFFQWAPSGNTVERVELDAAWWDKHLPIMRKFYDWYLSEIDNPAHLEPREVEIETLAARSLLDEYDRLSAQIGDASSRKKEVLAELVQIAKERNAVICGRKLTKVERSGTVAYAKIVAEKLPELDVEPWRGKASEYWRLA